MGNKLGRRRQVVDERYTKPQGLYVHKDVDIKKLKKLILESKLAPCYPGDEECCCDLEECPICFLYYPSLNRSRCCMKGICTECFLQMKNPNTTRPTQCPFCKTTNYAVEYRGMKTKEEKGIEQIEEQRVMEAKIRIRQQELLDEEERMQKRQELSSSSTIITPREVEYNAVAVSSSRSLEDGEIVSDSRATPIRQPSRLRANGDDEFDLDLEDIMVMEAIWLSIQENDRPRNPDFDASEQYVMEDRHVASTLAPMACSSSSPSGGLACAIAALAERQQMGGESSSIINHRNVSAFSMLPDSGRLYNNSVDQDAENHPLAQDSISSSPDGRAVAARDEGDWGVDRGTELAEASTSYASSSDVTEDGGGNEIVGNLENVPGPIVPESFEEQMMLAMAVSLAEARSMTSGSGISWQ